MSMAKQSIAQTYRFARGRYGDLQVNVDAALQALAKISVSLHCWQGDDVGGFEKLSSNLLSHMQPKVAPDLGEGLAVTDNLPIAT